MPEKIIPERINKTRIKKIKINTWLEDKRYKQLKREVCRAKPFESCLYDKRGNPLGQFGTMHSTSLFTHTALMRFIFEQKQLFPEKPTFLDLGSGIGNMTIYAVHHGWKGIGIEFSEECYKASLENIKTASDADYIKKDNIKIIHSSFFPKGFKIEKKEKEGEDDFRKNLKILEKKAPKKITSEVLKKVDLFYHYQVERRQNILNFFAEYAKDNSMLVFVETREDSYTLPSNVTKLDYQAGMAIYKKI